MKGRPSRSAGDDTGSGELRVDPGLGAEPRGLLVYDASGRFSDQFMRVRPVGDTRVRGARMAVNGNTVATSGEKRLGEPVDLIWMRIGAR